MCKHKTYEIGVNLALLNKMLKVTEKDDEFELYIDNDDKQNLYMNVGSSDVKRITEFKMKLMEVSPTNLSLPDVNFDVMITMSSAEFRNLCKNMAPFGKHLEIKCTNNTLFFTCEGENTSIDTKYYANDDGIKIVYTNPNKELIIQGIYELKHLNLFSKCVSLSSEVQLMMKVKTFPLVIKYTVATLGEFTACITPINPSTTQITQSYENCETLYQSDDEVLIKKDLEYDDKEN